MKPFRPTALLAASSLAACALAVDSLRIDAQPAFRGLGADFRTMAVTLDNDGPDARGVLRVLGYGGGSSYPVELPHGAHKRLVVLNGGADYGSIRLVLDTDQGSTVNVFPGGTADYHAGGSAVLIGGAEGDLAFLRQQETEGKQKVEAHDLYVSPEEAPSRAAAYTPFNAVVLGPDSVRLDDVTVSALKDYALGGGTLVFLGGRRAEALADRRWADVLPGTDWRPKTVSLNSALAKLGGMDVSSPFTVVEPASIASGTTTVKSEMNSGEGTPFEHQRDLGLGRVVVLGYSPLDAPLNDWDGRLAAFRPFVRTGDSLRAHQYVENYLNSGLSETEHFFNTMANPSEAQSAAADPFSTKLPPTGTVFGLLAGYFILVVPASFLVLRKLKRGELAWVTAPLLSLGFAGALFSSAQGLYAAKLSTASHGVVVLQEGQPRAMFYGTSQMFFPHSGNYDLRLKNVDQLTAVRANDNYGSSALAGFDPVDSGTEITVPSLEANNLAFREMSFSQRIPNGDWFRIDLVDADHVRVENRSPYGFRGSVAAGDRASAIETLLPYHKSVLKLSPPLPHAASTAPNIMDAHSFTEKSDRIALEGRISGFRPGPHIGNEVQFQSGIDVIAFAQEKMR